MPATNENILSKILATVGPATSDPQMLCRLIDEGARAFRINFSHGTFDDFEKALATVREASRLAGVEASALGDLSGPKLRVSKVDDIDDDGHGGKKGIILEPGDTVELQYETVLGTRQQTNGNTVLSTNYPQMVDEIEPGQRLLVDDGAIRMLVTDKKGDPTDPNRRLICNVTVGGRISSAKGINLPDTELSAPSITERDWECAQWAVDHGIDYLALSFVRNAGDIQELRTFLQKQKSDIPIIAKIEKPQAINDLENIVNAADGLMVARGDLGVEMDLAMVPVIQKRIIRMAHDYGKPVIVATQMLQSMIEAPVPTRAEASDVANAIFDGADAVMLSGETAVGHYPVQAVHTMAHIARASEENRDVDPNEMGRAPRKARETKYRTAALAHGVAIIVKDLDAKAVVTWSELGGTARYLSQNRLPVPIITFSSNQVALRRMNLMFGVVPIYLERPATPDEFVAELDRRLLETGWVQPGDPIVITKGEPLGLPGVTNKIRIHYAGDVCRVSF